MMANKKKFPIVRYLSTRLRLSVLSVRVNVIKQKEKYTFCEKRKRLKMPKDEK